MKSIKLKEGQKVLDEKGDVYLMAKLEEGKEQSFLSALLGHNGEKITFERWSDKKLNTVIKKCEKYYSDSFARLYKGVDKIVIYQGGYDYNNIPVWEMDWKDFLESIGNIENYREKKVDSHSMKKLNEKYEDKVLVGFLAGALFTGTDSEDESLDSNFDTRDFDKDSYRKADKIVKAFLLELPSDPETIIASVRGQDYESLGIDLWMTMTGQGVGFWDGDWDEFGDELTMVAKKIQKKYYVEGATTFDGVKVEIF